MQIIINFNSISIDLDCHYISYFYPYFVIIHDNYQHHTFVIWRQMTFYLQLILIILSSRDLVMTKHRSNPISEIISDETQHLLYIFKYVFNIFTSWFSIIALIISKSSIICFCCEKNHFIDANLLKNKKFSWI